MASVAGVVALLAVVTGSSAQSTPAPLSIKDAQDQAVVLAKGVAQGRNTDPRSGIVVPDGDVRYTGYCHQQSASSYDCVFSITYENGDAWTGFASVDGVTTPSGTGIEANARQFRCFKRQKSQTCGNWPDWFCEEPVAVAVVAGLAHKGHDLFHRWRVGGIEPPLVAGRTSGVVAGQGRRRATPTGGIEQC